MNQPYEFVQVVQTENKQFKVCTKSGKCLNLLPAKTTRSAAHAFARHLETEYKKAATQWAEWDAK